MTMAPRLHVRMSARRDDEAHRAATPFELLFDLVFVVAVASLVSQVADATVGGSLGPSLIAFPRVFEP